MTKGKSTWKYNKLLTARRNYYGFGSSLKQAFDFKDLENAQSSPLSGAVSAAGSLVGQVGGNLIGGGLESGAGKVLSGLSSVASAIPGPWGAVASAGLGLVGGLTNRMFGSKLNEENINNIKNQIASVNNVTANASTYDDLANNMSSTADVQGFSNKFIGSDGWFSNKAKSVANSLREMAFDANRRKDLTFSMNAQNIGETTMGNMQAEYMALGGPLFARGGGIHIAPSKRGTFTAAASKHNMGVQEFASKVLANKEDYSSTMVKKANFARNASKWKHAFGGDLMTHGAIFDTGLTSIGNGGSHEENPYEGVPMGVDQEGTPNLVEEGETIFNDYVFSKRLRVPKTTRNKYKLGGPISFADASKKLAKESEERPNDPISQNGLQAFMSDLANIQEEVRSRQQQNQFANGGKVNKFDGTSTPTQRLNTYSNYTPLKDDSFYTPEYMNFWNYLSNAKNSQDAQNWLKRINSGEFGTIGGNTFTIDDILRLAHDYKQGPVHNAFKKAAMSGDAQRQAYANTIINDVVTDPDIPAAPRDRADLMREIDLGRNNLGTTKKIEVPSVDTTSSYKDRPTWMRYAPVVGAGIGLMQGLLSKPDYGNADMILEAGRNAANAPRVTFNPIGNYLGYRPFDREFYINQLNAQSGATRRAVLQNAGLNRGAGTAALLAADYNAQGQLGQLARQAEEYNLAQRQQVEGFNRGTNQFNSEGALKAAVANQEAALKGRSAYLSAVAQAANMRENINNARSASISGNFTNLVNSLGNIGLENYNMNDRDMLLRTGWAGTLSQKPQDWSDESWSQYQTDVQNAYKAAYNRRNNIAVTAAKGGKLRKKKRGLTI